MSKFISDNIILDSDVYKHTHWKMIPKNVKYTYAYQESRGVTDKGVPPETVVFGYQYYIKRYLQGKVITEDMIIQAAEFMSEIFGTDEYFNEEGWKYILKTYDGKLPVLIKAVPEGMVIPSHNVLMSIENTDPKVPWLTTFIETLLMRSW